MTRAFPWITSDLLPEREADDLLVVRHLLPSRYSHFYKLLHPIYENVSIVDREMTVVEWTRIDNSLDYDDPDPKSLRRVLWRDVAEQYQFEGSKLTTEITLQ